MVLTSAQRNRVTGSAFTEDLSSPRIYSCKIAPAPIDGDSVAGAPDSRKSRHLPMPAMIACSGREAGTRSMEVKKREGYF